MTQFDTGLPSIRQVQGFIKDKREIHLKLSTGEVLSGKILWQDAECLCLTEPNGNSILVWRQSIVYLKP